MSKISILRASANDKVGAFQHIFQMQVPDWMSEPWDAQHCHLVSDLHIQFTAHCQAIRL